MSMHRERERERECVCVCLALLGLYGGLSQSWFHFRP